MRRRPPPPPPALSRALTTTTTTAATSFDLAMLRPTLKTHCVAAMERLGNADMVDGILKDGLGDACGKGNELMGVYAELCAREHAISREDQDTHALKR